MFARTLISLAASLLITAAIVTLLALSVHATPRSAPTMIDGLPVTNLPAVTVMATVPRPHPIAHSHKAHKRTVALVENEHPLSRLLEGAATQVANSHLAMPYYSFGSPIGQADQD